MARQRILKVAGVFPAQHARWVAAAQGGRSLSAWLRAAADHAVDGGVGLTGGDVGRIEAALRDVRAALNGTQAFNNLNQIMHALHLDSLHGVPSYLSSSDADIVDAVRAVRDIKDRIQAALDDLRMLRP